MGNELESLTRGMEIPYGGNKVTVVPENISEAFQKGDRLIVEQTGGDLSLIHI